MSAPSPFQSWSPPGVREQLLAEAALVPRDRQRADQYESQLTVRVTDRDVLAAFDGGEPRRPLNAAVIMDAWRRTSDGAAGQDQPTRPRPRRSPRSCANGHATAGSRSSRPARSPTSSASRNWPPSCATSSPDGSS